MSTLLIVQVDCGECTHNLVLISRRCLCYMCCVANLETFLPNYVTALGIGESTLLHKGGIDLFLVQDTLAECVQVYACTNVPQGSYVIS